MHVREQCAGPPSCPTVRRGWAALPGEASSLGSVQALHRLGEASSLVTQCRLGFRVWVKVRIRDRSAALPGEASSLGSAQALHA